VWTCREEHRASGADIYRLAAVSACG